DRPFRLVESGTASLAGLDISSTGTGQATHLGRFTLERSATLYDPTGTVFQVDGKATLTAANGDTLTASIEGSVDLSTGRGVLIYEWPGGTGRFAHATGTTPWLVSVNLADLTYTVTADGILRY